jgi:hypothetical protein
MAKYFVTFASRDRVKERGGNFRYFEREAQQAAESTRRYGFYPHVWIEKEISATEFCARNPDYMAGYKFKPYIIWQTLQDVDYGDFVLWMDSNHILIADPQPILDIAETYGIFCHDHWTNGRPKIYPNADWTRRDMFLVMNCDGEMYWRAPQIQINILAFCKTPTVLEFCSQWLTYCCDKRLMTLDPTNVLGLPNLPNYQENRSEQSVFSILQVKYGIPAQTDPLHIHKELEV